MSGKLTINYINGNKDAFEFSPATTPGLAGTNLKEMLSSPAIVRRRTLPCSQATGREPALGQA